MNNKKPKIILPFTINQREELLNVLYELPKKNIEYLSLRKFKQNKKLIKK